MLATAIIPTIPAAIAIIPTAAPGPVSPIRIAASTRSHNPAAAAPNPTPAPSMFFAAEDITLDALCTCFAELPIFPAPLIASTKDFTFFATPDIFLNAKNPARAAGRRDTIFSNAPTESSCRKSMCAWIASPAASINSDTASSAAALSSGMLSEIPRANSIINWAPTVIMSGASFTRPDATAVAVSAIPDAISSEFSSIPVRKDSMRDVPASTISGAAPAIPLAAFASSVPNCDTRPSSPPDSKASDKLSKASPAESTTCPIGSLTLL